MVLHEGVLICNTGCFHGPATDFLAAVQGTHGDSIHGKAYRAAVEFARVALECPITESEAGK
jgi:hypothetical protein